MVCLRCSDINAHDWVIAAKNVANCMLESRKGHKTSRRRNDAKTNSNRRVATADTTTIVREETQDGNCQGGVPLCIRVGITGGSWDNTETGPPLSYIMDYRLFPWPVVLRCYLVSSLPCFLSSLLSLPSSLFFCVFVFLSVSCLLCCCSLLGVIQ